MNYLHPVYKKQSKERREKELEFIKEEINITLDKMVIISQLSEGGITFGDCETMDAYELEYVARKMIAMKKEENRIREKQFKEAQQNAKK